LFCVSFRFREVGIGVVLCFVSVSRSEHFAHFGIVSFRFAYKSPSTSRFCESRAKPHEATRGPVSVSFRVEGKSGSRAAVSFRVEGKPGSCAARRFRFRFVSSGARFRETGLDFLVLSVTLVSGLSMKRGVVREWLEKPLLNFGKHLT
jgi:hypothetical protein